MEKWVAGRLLEYTLVSKPENYMEIKEKKKKRKPQKFVMWR